jgi:hypothetical protein
MNHLMTGAVALIVAGTVEAGISGVLRVRRGRSRAERVMSIKLRRELASEIGDRTGLLEAAEDLLASTGALTVEADKAVLGQKERVRNAWLALQRQVQYQHALRSAMFGTGENRRFGLRQLSGVGSPVDAAPVKTLIDSDMLEPATLALAERVAEELLQRDRRVITPRRASSEPVLE